MGNKKAKKKVGTPKPGWISDKAIALLGMTQKEVYMEDYTRLLKRIEKAEEKLKKES